MKPVPTEPKYYTLPAVAKMTGLTSSNIRYWETQFSQLSPRRDNHLNRYYTAEDIAFIKRVKYIRDELHITRIDGIKRVLLRDENIDPCAVAYELVTELKRQLIAFKEQIEVTYRDR